MADASNNFIALLNRSTNLLHQIDGIDWKALVLETAAPEVDLIDQENEDESEEESDDDDLFGMLGGYESSGDEKEGATDILEEELEDDNEEEEEAALLKRAAAVHNALLLSVDTRSAKRLEFDALIDTTIGALVDKAAPNTLDDLAKMLSYTLSPSTFEDRPKSFRWSHERWRKICSTNALLSVQFLLHLMQSDDALSGWNRCILPLLLGNLENSRAYVSLLMTNDALRKTVLNLTPTSAGSQPLASNLAGQVKDICSLCLEAINDATFSSNVVARQMKINVVSSVLIHLFDSCSKLSKGIEADLKSMEDLVKNIIHQAVLIIVRGICYEKVDDGFKVQPPLLSVDALRVVSGMLLLNLYPPQSNNMKTKTSSVADGKALELWREILMLISPYSEDLIENASSGQFRRCSNWNQAAPLSATSILCIVLPTFLSMELPAVYIQKDSTHCRPAMQHSLWKLLRLCLSKCGDSPNFTSRYEGGDGGGRGGTLLSREMRRLATDDESLPDVPIDQILRRRAAHCVRLLVEHERELLKRNSGGNSHGSLPREYIDRADTWMKYILVFEMLEMEIELHLVDQVWPTMKELASFVAVHKVAAADETEQEIYSCLPQLVGEDLESILQRVLLSEAPTLRKLGLYRLLKGDAGIDVTPLDAVRYSEDVNESDDTKIFMQKPKSKWKIKKDTGDQSSLQLAPLSMISVTFVIDIVIVSYDSIIGTKVGTNMQIDVDGTLKSESITPMLSEFLQNYAISIAVNRENADRLSKYVNHMFSSDLIRSVKPRSLVTFFGATASALESIAASSFSRAVLEPDIVRDAIRTMLAEFSSGGAPQSLQEALKHDLAVALQHTKPWTIIDANLVLQILALYPPEEHIDNAMLSVKQRSRSCLKVWLGNLANGGWPKNAASACSSAFVIGDLIPFNGDWRAGVDDAERDIGMALCTLAALQGNASEALWPAVLRGLNNVDAPNIFPTSFSFHRANRSIILLEFGCREKVLSGIGNGDLVADNGQSLLPPPPKVEEILHNAIALIMAKLSLVSTSLLSTADGPNKSGANRSSEANAVSNLVASLIGQLNVFYHAYPSSVSLPLVANNNLQRAAESLIDNPVESQILLYAALSCGAKFVPDGELDQVAKTCNAILGIDVSSLIHNLNSKKESKQALRSVFQYAKWGCISSLVPLLTMKGAKRLDLDVGNLCQKVVDIASDSVDATPVIALKPLFKSVVSSSVHITSSEETCTLVSLKTTIDCLFAILDEENTSANWVYMLHEICKLVFRPELLRREYQTEKKNEMPILRAFEKLLKMGGTTKPHICKTAVSIISLSWLGAGDEDSNDTGVLAIPYRSHIVDLLTYKEGKVDESALHQSSYQENVEGLPKNTDASSITRAFVLVFLSKLPSLESITDVVLCELVHFIIDELIEIGYKGPTVGKPFITGSEEYARAVRSWQALCLLNQYINDKKAEEIAPKVFQAMTHNTHGPVRYFIEVFVIQCTRKHPDVFGTHYIREINRTDLSLQYVSSLMVLGGNIIVGKYSSEFFQDSSKQRIKDVLCGVIPWLSSTQGFSRAIAQLLVHKLIPLVVDVNSDLSHTDKCKDDAVLASIYTFLENNGEMSRLRAKQANFFNSYDVEGACSLEGLLSIPVDEGLEANPTHMVDAIKDCLVEVYGELHEEEAPLWKQMEDLSVINLPSPACNESEKNDMQEEAALVNFQRKILPVDALDLNIQSMKNQKLFNAAGKRKQNLIICATLVDKVPNLAGLARTAEIFSASTLVMPNLLVRKQDDFKTISASANDWIEMEECKEDELLSWLYKKKSAGYTVVGLEQTSSSKCITKFKFPDKTVLLLGKEKEGIPVEFLSVVDQCIEIPQLGIIRSLNVHVTGAIAIWKYTEQMLRKNSKGLR